MVEQEPIVGRLLRGSSQIHTVYLDRASSGAVAQGCLGSMLGWYMLWGEVSPCCAIQKDTTLSRNRMQRCHEYPLDPSCSKRELVSSLEGKHN